VPLLAFGPGINPVDLGTRPSFADLGQTVAQALAVPALAHGTSFWEALQS
jgi:phosphopentomutase